MNMWKAKTLQPRDDRGPLRVMFVITSMPVGGAETLLVNLIRNLDREQFLPEVCCLKERGPLGEVVAREVPVHSGLLEGKFDLRILVRLSRLLRERRIDAVVTVGAGDKMFWGRLAAWWTQTPVVLSALHSTGWPDGVGRMNRWLTSITDGFIAVAAAHGEHLVQFERFPRRKVHVIPNGVDVERFHPQLESASNVRAELGIPSATTVFGIVASLSPVKNHALFLDAAARLHRQRRSTAFVIVGDGPLRESLEQQTRERELANCVHFLGARSDIAELLPSFDVLALTSHNEANPVCLLEGMATELPVVSTRVGSIPETIEDGENGFLIEPDDAATLAARWLELANSAELRQKMGAAGRKRVENRWSLPKMVEGYQELISKIYTSKAPPRPSSENVQDSAERRTPGKNFPLAKGD